MTGVRQYRVPTASPITDKERSVLDVLIDRGASNIEIGRRLYLSEKTVKFHIQNAMRKLGADNRTHAALLWYARGIEEE